MRFIQPYPVHGSPIVVSREDRVACSVPVFFIRYRYRHHAAASGYDRLCDYIGETITLSKTAYWLGETLLRLPAIVAAKLSGHFEYSRHDFTMELDVIRHFLKHHNSVYHYVYGEKCYDLLSHCAGRNGNKIVLTVHQPPEKNTRFLQSVEHFRKVDIVTVVSRSQVGYWEGVVGKGKVVYEPHGVDVDYFHPAEKAGSQRCLLTGGHERDFDCLPELVRLILGRSPAAEFVMVAKDPRCRLVAAQHKRAIWCPRVSDAEYLRLCQQSDLLVLPLTRSTACNSILEAMACGLPVVTNTGGIEDYVDSSCGRLLSIGDTAGMAGVVCDLLERPSELTQMGRAARKRAFDFSWTRTAERMRDIYVKLVASVAGTGGPSRS